MIEWYKFFEEVCLNRGHVLDVLYRYFILPQCNNFAILTKQEAKVKCCTGFADCATSRSVAVNITLA